MEVLSGVTKKSCGEEVSPESESFAEGKQMKIWRILLKRGFSCSLLFLFALFYGADTPYAQDWLGKAKEEKKLVLYHVTNVPDTTQIIAGFRQKYPFMEVDSYRATGEKLFQKITTEVMAGRHPADAYIISGLQTWLLKERGLLGPYRSPEREQVAPALKDEVGYWTGLYWNLEVIGYNTKMVSPREVPKKWEDLLAPRWKGQIGLEEEDVNWYVMILQLMGEEKGREYARRLARQEPQLRAGHTLLAQLLVAGEFSLGPTTRIHQGEDYKVKGAPVDWTAIEPLAPNPPICVSLPKDPPRPNAARLFIDFMLSREGQKIVYALRRNPSRTDVEQPVPRAAKIKLLKLDYEAVAREYGRYAKEFREIFGHRR